MLSIPRSHTESPARLVMLPGHSSPCLPVSARHLLISRSTQTHHTNRLTIIINVQVTCLDYCMALYTTLPALDILWRHSFSQSTRNRAH